MIKNDKQKSTVIFVLFLAYIVCLFIFPLFGADSYKVSAYFDSADKSLESYILKNIRVPRVMLGYLAGGVLSIGGLVFQSVFRNPLATPFTLGVSSGCSFGAAVYLVLFANSALFALFGAGGISLFAFFGGMLACGCIFFITSVKRSFHGEYMLLAGIAVTLFFSSMVLIIQYLANFHQTFLIFRWLIGGLESISYVGIIKLAPVAVLSLAVVFMYCGELDLLLTGEEIAASKGIAVSRVKIIMFVIVSFIVSYIVSICGPIAFIDMIIPNICRMIFGPKHNFLIFACFLSGGIFLSFCDTLSRVLLSPSELPVGIITALLGGIFFIWVLVKQSR